jgi:cytoskeletal protein RodZ
MNRRASILSAVVAIAVTTLAMVTVAFAAQQHGGGLGQEKVTLCHKGHTITVGAPALAAHERHGDTEGACETATPETPETTTPDTTTPETTTPDTTTPDTTTPETTVPETTTPDTTTPETTTPDTTTPEDEGGNGQEKVIICHEGHTITVDGPRWRPTNSMETPKEPAKRLPRRPGM